MADWALARGVPVCVVPHGRDQFEVARRVEFSHSGTRLPAKKLTTSEVEIKGAASDVDAVRSAASRRGIPGHRRRRPRSRRDRATPARAAYLTDPCVVILEFRRGMPARLGQMSALDVLDDWPVPTVAAAVVGPSG